MWRIVFRASHKAIPGPLLNTEEIAPSFFSVQPIGANEEKKMNKILTLCIAGSLALCSSAKELPSFMGVKFGSNISEGKFEGPDEDGDYTFLPEGAQANPYRSFVANVTHTSKRVYGVSIIYVMAEAEVDATKRSGLAQWTKALGSDWTAPSKLERALYYNEVKALGVANSDYAVYLFKNDAGEVCQLFQMFVLRDSGVARLAFSVTDVNLSELDDAEKSGKVAASQAKPKEEPKGKKQGKDSPAQGKVMSGADIINGHNAKENGYSDAQLKKLAKHLKGKQLTFENGVVHDIDIDDDDDSVTVMVGFGGGFLKMPFIVHATMAPGEMSEMAAELDEGVKIKRLTGTVTYDPDFFAWFSINKATIVVGE